MGQRVWVVLEMLVAFLARYGIEVLLRDELGQAVPALLCFAVLGDQQGLEAIVPHALVEDDAGECVMRGFTGAQFYIARNDGTVAGFWIVEAFGIL